MAEKTFQEAGLEKRVQVLRGLALETLPGLEKEGPFDFCFVDADKNAYPAYVDWASDNLRPGGLIALDNAYLFGELYKRKKDSGYEFFDLLTENPKFACGTMIPTGEGLAVGVRT